MSAPVEFFVDALFGQVPGHVAIAVGTGGHWDNGRYKFPPESWAERSIPWPAGRAELLALSRNATDDVYLCPALRVSPGRKGFTRPEGSNAAPLSLLWADLDGATDEALLEALDPLVVDSGRGRHVYVGLTGPVPIGVHRTLNRALAVRLSADTKWSDEVLLRLPGTANHKTDPPAEVTVIRYPTNRRSPDELAELLGVDLSAPLDDQARPGAVGDLTPEDPPDPLPKYVQAALDNPDCADKSKAHHRVVGACRESGLTLGQTLAVCLDYPPSVAKYDGRDGGVALQVEASWERIGPTRAERERADFEAMGVDYSRFQPATTANGQAPGFVVPPPVNEPPPGQGSFGGPLLPAQWFDDLAYEVDNAPPRQWLIRGMWPAGDYGVMSAEPKAQKTWTALDLAVSVATGGKWMDHKPVDVQGPVLVFVGEGGKGNTVRRLRAIAEAKGVPTAGLQIAVVARAPHLANSEALAEVAALVRQAQPKLVIIDPLYLAARGADLTNLYGMGAVLENIQMVCQGAGASLLLVHHFNRNTAVTGAARNAGAGPQEWARVLLSITVVSDRKGEQRGETVKVTRLEAQGGEIPDQTVTITRRVWADHPDDLTSALHIVTKVSDNDAELAEAERVAHGGVKLSQGQAKLLTALAAAERPETRARLIDIFAELHGNGLTEDVSTRFLNYFQKEGLADHEPFVQGSKEAKRWFITDKGIAEQNRRSGLPTTPDRRGSGEDPNLSTSKTAGQDYRPPPTGHPTVSPEWATSDRDGRLYREAPPAVGGSVGGYTNGYAEDPQDQPPGAVDSPVLDAPAGPGVTAVPTYPADMSPEAVAYMERLWARGAPAPTNTAPNGKDR